MSAAPIRLSASVMTHNSRRWLDRCLNALAFCDEIVIVDDSSTDGTPEHAKQLSSKVRVVQRQLDTLAHQRRFQQETARGEWLLIVDADEEVTPELAREIREVVERNPVENAFLVTQRNVLPSFWPRPVHYTTSQKRLMRRQAVRWADAQWVHAPLLHEGKSGRLQHPLTHQSFDSVSHLLKKQLHYGLSGAKHLASQGKHASGWSVLRHTVGNFLKFYFVKGLVFQGTGGFIVASALASSAFTKYAGVWERGYGEPAHARDRVPGEK